MSLYIHFMSRLMQKKDHFLQLECIIFNHILQVPQSPYKKVPLMTERHVSVIRFAVPRESLHV